MSIVFTHEILPFAGAVLLLAALLPVAWRNRRSRAARWFGASLASLIAWAIVYILGMVSSSLLGKLLYADIQTVALVIVSICWCGMIRDYLGLKRLPAVLTTLVWIVPTATLVATLIDPSGFFWRIPNLETGTASFAAVHARFGLWYLFVLLPEIGLLNASALVLLGRAIRRAQRFYRRQYAILCGSLLLSLVGTLLYLVDLPPQGTFKLPAALAGLSGFILAMGLFRWRVLDIVPLARDLVLEDLADAVIVADAAGRIVDLNPSAERLTGLQRKAAVGRPAEEALAAYPALARSMSCTDAAARMITREDIIIDDDGVSRSFSLSSSPVATRHGDYLGRAAVLHEVTERVRLFEQARNLANKDDLTGLPNRRHFLEVTTKEFERASRYARPLSLMLIDVDHFKRVNDTYGHRAGDLVLRELAIECQDSLRSSDVIGRFGGEEFAVLLPETDLGEAVTVAYRLRERIGSQRLGEGIYGDGITVTFSIGLTEFSDASLESTDSLDAALERADKALYRAKSLGRDMVVASKGSAMLGAPALRAAM